MKLRTTHTPPKPLLVTSSQRLAQCERYRQRHPDRPGRGSCRAPVTTGDRVQESWEKNETRHGLSHLRRRGCCDLPRIVPCRFESSFCRPRRAVRHCPALCRCPSLASPRERLIPTALRNSVSSPNRASLQVPCPSVSVQPDHWPGGFDYCCTCHPALPHHGAWPVRRQPLTSASEGPLYPVLCTHTAVVVFFADDSSAVFKILRSRWSATMAPSDDFPLVPPTDAPSVIRVQTWVAGLCSLRRRPRV